MGEIEWAGNDKIGSSRLVMENICIVLLVQSCQASHEEMILAIVYWDDPDDKLDGNHGVPMKSALFVHPCRIEFMI
jgi:hypothetical protein